MKNSFIIDYKNDEKILEQINIHFFERNSVGKISIENRNNLNIKNLIGWPVKILNPNINSYLGGLITDIDETKNTFEVTFKETNVYIDEDTKKYNFY